MQDIRETVTCAVLGLPPLNDVKKKTKQHEGAKENDSKPQEHVKNRQWKVGGRINGNGN